MKVTRPSQLDPDRKTKFDFLKGKCGLFNMLRELEGLGYIPDHPQSKPLDIALDGLYEKVEEKGYPW